MATEQAVIILRNERIITFFKTHPALNVEDVVLNMIDMLEKVMANVHNELNSTLAIQLVEQMKQMQSQMNLVQDQMTKNHTHEVTVFATKLGEFKKEYMEELKMVFSHNVTDRFAPLLKEQNAQTLDKLQLLVSEIVPKSRDGLQKHLTEAVASLHTSLMEDTNKFLSSSINPKTLQDFITNLEQKFNQSEQRLDLNIREIRSSTDLIRNSSTVTQTTTTELQHTVSDMLKKLDNSSSKGGISENIVFNLLQSMFPSGQIEYVGQVKESGDIILRREGKTSILIENKNWERNVSKDEVKKFVRDIEVQNCAGLFLSQNTGIANKQNFEISIHEGKALLFIHNVNYDADKIRVGIDIIDYFQEVLDKFSEQSSGVDTINKEVLDIINKEFQEFCGQKLNAVKTLKDFQTKMLKQFEEMRFPALEAYLSARYTFSGKLVCGNCNYIAKNQQALSAHSRGCSAATTTKIEIETEVGTTTTPVAKKVKTTVAGK